MLKTQSRTDSLPHIHSVYDAEAMAPSELMSDFPSTTLCPSCAQNIIFKYICKKIWGHATHIPKKHIF